MSAKLTLPAPLRERLTAFQVAPTVAAARSIAATLAATMAREAKRLPVLAESATAADLAEFGKAAAEVSSGVVAKIILSGPPGARMDVAITVTVARYRPSAIVAIVPGERYLIEGLDLAGVEALAPLVAEGFKIEHHSTVAGPLLIVRRLLPEHAAQHVVTLHGGEWAIVARAAIDAGLGVYLTHIGDAAGYVWNVRGDSLALAGFLSRHAGAAGRTWAEAIIGDVKVAGPKVALSNTAHLADAA